MNLWVDFGCNLRYDAKIIWVKIIRMFYHEMGQI